MAVYDLINGHQVQCFKNNLKNYQNGELVPLKTKSYYYEDTIIIVDTLTPVKKPFEKMVHIIRDSKVEGSYEIGNSKSEIFVGINNYYTDTGKKLNVDSYEKVIAFLYDEYKLQLDIDFVNVCNYDNDKTYNMIEKLECAFYDKWYR